MRAFELIALAMLITSCGSLEAPTREDLRSNLTSISAAFRLVSDVAGCPIVVTAEGTPPSSATFIIRNRSEEPWQIMEIYLPWRGAVQLLALRADGKVLKHRWPRPDGRYFREVGVEPGASISGTLDLRQVLPGLEATLKETSVLLLWVFRPAGLTPECAPSGVVELTGGERTAA
ncbi:MAG: hypothetical protein WBO54_14550 [Thermoanaerobaculia bacterium]